MEWNATGDPVVTQEDPQVEVGIDLQEGTLILTRDGRDLTAYHARVEFAAAHGFPWTAEKVTFSAHGPDEASVTVAMDLLNKACDGPREDVPEAIWKVVALAATCAGDVGITYAAPAP
ncbi:hypothetical protein ACIRP0_31525 [Streptomyces sp. NPDC101733]|uniref:hypothetical protein n=1 Tax=unclassified Streptomyces TaxID=2593676 RepID=UPI0038019C98